MGRDRDRDWQDRDGSGTAACGNGWERDWKTSPVQHSSADCGKCSGLYRLISLTVVTAK